MNLSSVTTEDEARFDDMVLICLITNTGTVCFYWTRSSVCCNPCIYKLFSVHLLICICFLNCVYFFINAVFLIIFLLKSLGV